MSLANSLHRHSLPPPSLTAERNTNHGLIDRYDSCPREDDHVESGRCLGWCVLDWYRLYSGNLGVPKYRSSSTLGVPYGMGEDPDKRRGGRWYLGIQALGGPAEYTVRTTAEAPHAIVNQGCSRLDRYCSASRLYADIATSSVAQRSLQVSKIGAVVSLLVAWANTVTLTFTLTWSRQSYAN